jgi:hypothetical protein
MAQVVVDLRRPSRAVAVRVFASAVLLAAVPGCTAIPRSGPVAVASTAPAASPAGAPRRPVPVARPPVGGRFDYQLGGAYAPPSDTAIVERDRSSAPAGWAYGICYVNAFQTQPEELAWWTAQHAGVLLAAGGGYVTDPDWPGEVLLDTSTPAKRAEAAAVVGGWIDGCAARGYQAVELDNLDSWTRSGGRLTAASNVAFARLLLARAHARGLAVAQKNAAELAPQGPGIGFDFALTEECQVEGECDAYLAAYGRHVIEVEYTDNGLDPFLQACAARGRQISLVLRDRHLMPADHDEYVYRRC